MEEKKLFRSVLDGVKQDAEDDRQEADQECGIRPEHKTTIYK